MPKPRKPRPQQTAPAGAAPVSWTTTLDDLVDGSHVSAVGLRRVVAAVGVAALAWGALTLAAGDIAFALFLLAYGLLDLAILFFRPAERVLFRGRVSRLVGQRCEAALGARGVTVRQAGAAGTIAWGDLESLREDARTFLLVAAGGSGRFGIPKRAFEGPEAVAAFRDEVRRRMAEARPPAR